MDLKELRTQQGLTQVEVAIKCQVSLSSYRLWESGVTKPTPENYAKLKEVLNIKE